MRIPTNQEFPLHPGGQDTLLLAREHDDWKELMFLSAHLGCDHDRISKTAKHLGLGELPQRGTLYHDIDAAVRKIKMRHPNAVWVFRFWCLFITLVLSTSLVMFDLTGREEYAAAFAMSTVSYAFNIFHTRNHRGGKVYDIAWLDRLTLPLYEAIDRTFMFIPNLWQHHHNGTHHMETNTLKDQDVTNPFNSGIRLSLLVPHCDFHEFQHFYTYLLLSINTFLYPINNYFKNGGHPVFFCLYFSLLYIIPVYQHGWGMARTVVLCCMCGSLTISLLFQVSHNHEDLGAPEECRNNNNKPERSIDDWMKVQIHETISWGGYMSCLFFGGINYQVEHHVAPCLCPVSSTLGTVFAALCLSGVWRETKSC